MNSLSKDSPQTLFAPYYFFAIWVVNPNGEKAIKGLGELVAWDEYPKGSQTTVTREGNCKAVLDLRPKGFPPIATKIGLSHYYLNGVFCACLENRKNISVDLNTVTYNGLDAL